MRAFGIFAAHLFYCLSLLLIAYPRMLCAHTTRMLLILRISSTRRRRAARASDIVACTRGGHCPASLGKPPTEGCSPLPTCTWQRERRTESTRPSARGQRTAASAAANAHGRTTSHPCVPPPRRAHPLRAAQPLTAHLAHLANTALVASDAAHSSSVLAFHPSASSSGEVSVGQAGGP